MKDANHFHHFKNVVCSWMDYCDVNSLSSQSLSPFVCST